MARIDLGGGDSKDDLEEALRQLERQSTGRKGAQPSPPGEPSPTRPEPDQNVEAARRRARREREAQHKRARGDIQGAVDAIRERQEAEQRAAARVRAPRRWPWIVLGAVVLGLIVVAAIALRPTPLPPAAVSAKEAVGQFWKAVADKHYEGATVFYPALVDKYGSRRQAGLYLAQKFGEDPPTKVTVGEADPLPGTDDVRVSFEVWRRSGRPYTGEFVVRDTGSEKEGYVIVTGI